MSEKRILRKMKKLASRIGDKIESVRDEVEDLEIEFEILQKQIKKLETKSFYDKETKGEKRQSDDEEDIDEIFESHMEGDKIVNRLLIK